MIAENFVVQKDLQVNFRFFTYSMREAVTEKKELKLHTQSQNAEDDVSMTRKPNLHFHDLPNTSQAQLLCFSLPKNLSIRLWERI